MMGNKFFNLLTLIIGNNFLPSMIVCGIMIIISTLFYNKDEMIRLICAYVYISLLVIFYIIGYYYGKIKTEYKGTSSNGLSKISLLANEIYNKIYEDDNAYIDDQCMKKVIKSINIIHKEFENKELKFYQLFIIEDYLVGIRRILKNIITKNELDKNNYLKIFYLYLKVTYLEFIILRNIDLVYSIISVLFKSSYIPINPIRFKNYIGIAEDFDSAFDGEKCDLVFDDIMTIINKKVG